MTETEKLIEIYNQLEDAGLMVIAGKKDSAELMVSHDVVPVVRCMDCELEGTENCPMVHKDPMFGNLYAEYKPDDFCSRGKRKDLGDGGGGRAKI